MAVGLSTAAITSPWPRCRIYCRARHCQRRITRGHEACSSARCLAVLAVMEVRHGHLLYPSRSAHLVRRGGSTSPLERLYRGARVVWRRPKRACHTRGECRPNAAGAHAGTGHSPRHRRNWSLARRSRSTAARAAIPSACAWRAAPTAMASRSGRPTTARAVINLWANRYGAATAAWGSPINIEASSADIDELRSHGRRQRQRDGRMARVRAIRALRRRRGESARFDAGAGAWATPVLLNTTPAEPRVASDATGAVLAVYVAR